MNERALTIALPDVSVLPSKRDRETRRPAAAKVYEFPARAAHQRDVKIDEADQSAHPAVILEIAAAMLAFAFWLVWRLTHLSSPR